MYLGTIDNTYVNVGRSISIQKIIRLKRDINIYCCTVVVRVGTYSYVAGCLMWKPCPMKRELQAADSCFFDSGFFSASKFSAVRNECWLKLIYRFLKAVLVLVRQSSAVKDSSNFLERLQSLTEKSSSNFYILEFTCGVVERKKKIPKYYEFRNN